MLPCVGGTLNHEELRDKARGEIKELIARCFSTNFRVFRPFISVCITASVGQVTIVIDLGRESLEDYVKAPS